MASSTTFTPQTFAKLSPHPFLLANLQPSTSTSNNNSTAGNPPARTNGRAPHEARSLQANASSLSHAHGSVMVRVGDTSVICGVRGELLPITSIPQWRTPKTSAEREMMSAEEIRREGAREIRDYDLLVPNIELATGCAPQFLPGIPPTTLAQTLSTRVYSLLHGAGLVDVDDLRVWYTPPKTRADGGSDQMEEDEEEAEPELKAFWTLYIDVLFISFDGNPFDAAWVAILAALRDTKLPKAWWDADREMVLCSRSESSPLNITGLPISCTTAVVTEKEKESTGSGKVWVLVDPDRLEESLCEENVTVVVDRSQGDTRIRGISKAGGRVLGPKQIREVVGLAERRWEEISQVLLT